MQDIFLKISAIETQDISNPTAYLYRLGWNLMLDKLRQQRRARSRDGIWLDARHNHMASEAIVDTPSAEDEVAGRQRLQRLLKALEDLSPRTQKVFRLHKFDGLSHAEVAKRLGISRSAVEKHVSAALRHLMDRME